ncbi:MAG: polysaccharide biosynthesis/export family protein [Muribaculaceae bacterium]|nr:polysaccharide biosynthesis/export family protein [Muribaculaceae bacterium]
MRFLYHNILVLGVAALLTASCSAPKKVPYLLDAETIPSEVLAQSQNVPDPVITVGDLLNIDVSGINMNVMAPFNKGRYIDTEGKIGNFSRSNTNTGNSGLEVSTEYYLVNSDGCIDFPIIGKIEVAGLTKSEVATKIRDLIYPKYVTEKPTVDIRLMNFRVTVAGAVKSPGVYQSKNERMTFLEAIAMAGDLDIKGDRENILLYRTNADGTREVHRLNLHDSNFLLSPYYNLQQNDFIYVTPNSSMRQGAWQMNPAVTATITIVGGMSSLASLVIGIINLSRSK